MIADHFIRDTLAKIEAASGPDHALTIMAASCEPALARLQAALARIAELEPVLREANRRLSTCTMAFEGNAVRTGEDYSGIIESNRTLAAKITTTLRDGPSTGEAR